jgi:hypothetical protein
MCSINHDKKCIFINIPKTGRTYISNALTKHYGFTEYLNVGNDNTFFADKHRGIIQIFQSPDVNAKIGMDSEKWNNYFIFCFVRNPYDRAVSGYHYVMKTHKKMHDINMKYKNGSNTSVTISHHPFNTFMQMNANTISNYTYIHTHQSQTTNMIDNDKQFVVDFVGRFENLENDFVKVLMQIGFVENEIVHDKTKLNESNHGDYKTYYDQQTLEIVNNLYADDFDRFGYVKADFVDAM